MSAPLKKPRQARIEHLVHAPSSASSSVKNSHSDDGSHLWVVSYADLLMVLLCFFVLFFSTDQAKRDSIIHKILITTQNTKTAVTSEGVGQGTSSSPATKDPSQEQGTLSSIHESLAMSLKNTNVKATINGESIILDLPNDSYKKGKVDLNNADGKLLSHILDQLKPYSKQIDIVFIGYTDSSPVHHARTRRVRDNLDLSSERAKTAMKQAVNLGFPANHLKIEGDASGKRSSRTLSINILEHGE